MLLVHRQKEEKITRETMRTKEIIIDDGHNSNEVSSKIILIQSLRMAFDRIEEAKES